MNGWQPPPFVATPGTEPYEAPRLVPGPTATWFDAAPPKPDPLVIKNMNDLLSAEHWATLDIPAQDKLLGDLMTTKTTGFLVGRTGLGKTLFGLSIACSIASGKQCFFDVDNSPVWKVREPRTVLYIDGEMPDELIKERVLHQKSIFVRDASFANLAIYSSSMLERIRERVHDFPDMPPLNSAHALPWLKCLLNFIGHRDVIIFDNVMSLLDGDQKDEETWSGTNQLSYYLKSVATSQLWLDHTGHDASRQYGSSTKGWRGDFIGIMTPLTDISGDEMGFQLSFDAPGKARRRTPANRSDFATREFRMKDNRWLCFDVSSKDGKAEPTEVAVIKKTDNRLLYDADLRNKIYNIIVADKDKQMSRPTLINKLIAVGGKSEPKWRRDLVSAISPMNDWIECDKGVGEWFLCMEQPERNKDVYIKIASKHDRENGWAKTGVEFRAHNQQKPTP